MIFYVYNIEHGIQVIIEGWKASKIFVMYITKRGHTLIIIIYGISNDIYYKKILNSTPSYKLQHKNFHEK